MTKLWLPLAIAAVVALAAAAALVLIDDDDGGTVPAATDVPGATTTIQPTSPPGPVLHGRFEILPTGSVPRTCGVPVPDGQAQDEVDIREGDTFDSSGTHALAVEPIVADDWGLTEVHVETVVWSDGTTTDSLFGVEYESPDGTLRFSRILMDSDCIVQVVGDWEPGTVGGEPAVVYSGAPAIVQWFDGDVLAVAEAGAGTVDLATVLELAEQIHAVATD